VSDLAKHEQTQRRLKEQLRLLPPTDSHYVEVFGYLVADEQLRRAEAEADIGRLSPAELYSRIQRVNGILRFECDSSSPTVQRALAALAGAPVDGPSAPAVPDVEAYLDDPVKQYVVRCPYCYLVHRHGVGGGLGARRSECADGSRPYRLVAPSGCP